MSEVSIVVVERLGLSLCLLYALLNESPVEILLPRANKDAKKSKPSSKPPSDESYKSILSFRVRSKDVKKLSLSSKSKFSPLMGKWLLPPPFNSRT